MEQFIIMGWYGLLVYGLAAIVFFSLVHFLRPGFMKEWGRRIKSHGMPPASADYYVNKIRSGHD